MSNINEYLEFITKFLENYIDINGPQLIINDIDFRNAFLKQMYFYIATRTEVRDKIIESYTSESAIDIIIDENNLILQELIRKKKNVNIHLKSSVNKNIYRVKYNIIKNNNCNYQHGFIILDIKFLKYILPILKEISSCLIILINPSQDSLELCRINNINFIILNYFFRNRIKKPEVIARNSFFLYKIACKILQQTKINSLVCLEGCHYEDEIFSMAASSQGAISICLQYGIVDFVHAGLRNMSFDVFLSWGEFFSNRLKQYNQTQKFINVGHLMLEKNPKSNKETTICFLITAASYVFPQKEFEDYCKVIIEIASYHPQVKIIIREHPNYCLSMDEKKQFKKLTNISFMHPSDFSLGQVLTESKIVIGISSTVLFECIHYSCIPVVYNLRNLNLYNELNLETNFIVVNDKETLYQTIKMLLISLHKYDKTKNMGNSRIFKCTGEDTIFRIKKVLFKLEDKI